jgi:hypothetical protein
MEMFHKLDLNKNGEIDLEEFTVLIRNNLISLFKFHLANLKEAKMSEAAKKGEEEKKLKEDQEAEE